MKDFTTLKILDRFQFIFKKLKIDYPVLRNILEVKFRLDSRRVPTMYANQKKKEDKDYFISSLWIYALYGTFMIIPFVFLYKELFPQMTMIFGVLMFLITSTVVADFSSVVLDVRDKIIIGTKPVESKTLTMAKFIHIFRYLLLVTMMLSAPGMIALFIKYMVTESIGFSILVVIIFLFLLILLNLFIIVFTTLLYILILKFFNGDKLKDIINYVQIMMTITIAIGYQVAIRLFEFVDASDLSFTFKWFHYFLTPVWFSAPFELFLNQNREFHFLILTIMVLVVPIIIFMIYLKLLPAFEDNLLKLKESATKNKVKNKKWGLYKILTHSKEEETFYRFSEQMMKSERDFKLKVYPSLGFSIIFPFIFIFQSFSTSQSIHPLQFLFIYFSALMLPTATLMLKYSVNYKAAWIYQVMPIQRKASIHKGVLKAFIVKLVLPIYLIEALIFLFLFDLSIIPDLICVLLVISILTVISFKIMNRELPFSQSFDNVNKAQGMFVMVFMMIIGFFVGIHFIFTLVDYGQYIYLGILFVVNYLTWKLAF